MPVVLVTGAATGIGNLTARTLAAVGHTVYASMRGIDGRNAERAGAERERAAAQGVDLRVVELDVLSADSAHSAVQRIVDEQGRLDIVAHNAGHLSIGVSEAFSPELFAAQFETNVLGAHRVNRAALPVMRAAGSGLLLYVGSTTSRMIYPFFGPYQATKAAFDALAETVGYEVSRYGIETVIVVPGAFTQGTEHFPNATAPDDPEIAAAYDRLAGVGEQVNERLQEMTPAGADPQAVADEITRVVALPAGTRPFRPSVDFLDDGAEEVNAEATRMQDRLLERLGIADLRKPLVPAAD